MSASPSKLKKPRYALITGAGSGLGREFCLQLGRLGWHLAVTDTDLVAAERTHAEIVAIGSSGQVELLDVTQRDAWQRLVDRLQHEWPRLDLLVNNAGVCGTGKVGSPSDDQFGHIFDVNFQGTLNGCQAMIPWLRSTAPGGCIVNVASIFGLVAPPTMAAYNCSKAAVVALSETLYGELRPHGIGVTVVAPGFFDSQLVERGHFASDEDRHVAKQYVANSKITAEDVVRVALSAANKGQLYTVLGRKARWIWRLKRLLPARFARIIAWRYRRKINQADD
ncbi:MAG: SDR family NAD(P)-dependent oxidoreductase [Planctomycetota bacterium]